MNANEGFKLDDIATFDIKDRLRRLRLLFLWSILVLLALTVVYPMLWVFSLSLKTQAEFDVRSPWSLPSSFDFSNYLTVIKNNMFPRYALNTLFIALVSVSLIVIMGAMSGYITAKFRSRLVNFIALAILAAMMIPRYMVLMPLMTIARQLDILSTPWAVIGPYVAFGVPFSLFIFRGFFINIPNSLAEAAKIDGASELNVFFHVMLPLTRPAMATVVVTQFLGTWNEFLLALVLLQDQSSYNLMLGLNSLRGQYIAQYPLQAAGLLLASFPTLVLYAFFNRTIIQGMVAGSVKQ